MNTYNLTFITNSEQVVAFTKSIEADNAKDARSELRDEAQIPARFILSCSKS